jgi:hypothetical protein
MEMRKIFSVVAVSVAVVSMSLFGRSGIASAADSVEYTDITYDPAVSGPHYWMYTDDGNPGGKIDFWPNGDIVRLCDTQADGKYAHATYIWSVNNHIHSVDLETVNGNGTCVVSRQDIPEEKCVFFVILLGPDFPAWEDDAYWLNDNDVKANGCVWPG